ncbi:hypothetical protein CMI48_02655 [Candidatus Pacearchaeota archaeon]|nr:hypothetical protein [Candidatus Pacearchaeota archaeon]
MIKPSEAVFANDKIEEAFYHLDKSDPLRKHITRAIQDIEQNAFCGIQIPKKLIPKEYVKKYEVTNLWKYDLPDGWRLIYSVTTPNKVEIITLILEWFDHTNYNRRFGY